MEKEEEEETEDTYTCNTCGRNFGSQRGLSIHETRSHDEDTD